MTTVSVSSLSLSVLDCAWDRLSDSEGPLPPSLLETPRPFHSPPSTTPACLRWMWPRRKVAFMKVLSHRWHYTEESRGECRISSPESSWDDSPSISIPIPWEPWAASQMKSLIYKVRKRCESHIHTYIKHIYICCCCLVANSCPTLLQPYELLPPRFLCPWDFPDQSIVVGFHFLLQGIFPTQGSNLHLLHCWRILYH